VKQRRGVQELFALLSVAVGPLPEEDVEAVTGLTVFDLSGLPPQVTRWFTLDTLDGTRTTYSLGHPLLAEAFNQTLASLPEQMERRLVAYCALWTEHHSLYAFQHLAHHLLELGRRSGDWSDLFNLARNQSFTKAQALHVTNEPGLPLETLRIALQGAMEANDLGSVAEFMIAHAHARNDTVLSSSPLDALRQGNIKRSEELTSVSEIFDFVPSDPSLAIRLRSQIRKRFRFI
jgi:hypothetical protein